MNGELILLGIATAVVVVFLLWVAARWR